MPVCLAWDSSVAKVVSCYRDFGQVHDVVALTEENLQKESLTIGHSFLKKKEREKSAPQLKDSQACT
jgi:hypothetical protein